MGGWGVATPQGETKSHISPNTPKGRPDEETGIQSLGDSFGMDSPVSTPVIAGRTGPEVQLKDSVPLAAKDSGVEKHKGLGVEAKRNAVNASPDTPKGKP